MQLRSVTKLIDCQTKREAIDLKFQLKQEDQIAKPTSKIKLRKSQVGDVGKRSIRSKNQSKTSTKSRRKFRNERVCQICKKLFKGNHKNCIMKQNETRNGPYCCDTCRRLFLRKNMLKKHVIVHSRKYACYVCSEEFKDIATS